jgi:hypothetical protein
MRKYLLLSGVAGLALSALIGASTAVADVTVSATITKDKTVTVTESVMIDKVVNLDVVVNSGPSKFAESNAIANQLNNNDRVCENCAEKSDNLVNSVNGNSGVTSVNQAAGNLNNQGSALAAAVDVETGPPPPTPTPGPTGDGFAEANASAQQINGDPKMVAPAADGNTIDTINIVFRIGLIENSINRNTGATFVNQATGNINNQTNLVSIAFSERAGGVALAESDLGQLNQNDFVQESASSNFSTNTAQGVLVGIMKTATITGSVDGNTGIVGVNQAVGNFANQANVFSLAATRPPGTP